MKLWMVIVAMCGLAVGASAENVVIEIPWPASLPEGVQRGANNTVTVASASDDGLTVTLARIDAPTITTDRYAVRGRVRYADVVGEGYLEMWNEFAEGSYFTRTLEAQGPMRAITGSSDWRPVVLLFDATDAEAPPDGLVVNLVLPGRGTVSVGALTLVELEPGEWPSGVSDSARFGVVGGVAGAVLGTFAGLLGWLGGRGKARRFVLTGFKMLLVLGVAAFAAGVVSLARGLPYDVFYALLLIGGISTAVSASTLPRLKKRYEELELRRMSALDA